MWFLQQDWMHKGHYVSSCNHWLSTGLNTKYKKKDLPSASTSVSCGEGEKSLKEPQTSQWMRATGTSSQPESWAKSVLIREGVADASRSQGRVPGGPEVSDWAAGGVLLPGVEVESMDGVRHGCERSDVSEQRAAMSGTSMNWLHSRNCCRLRRSPDLRYFPGRSHHGQARPGSPDELSHTFICLLEKLVTIRSVMHSTDKPRTCELSSPWAGKVGVEAKTALQGHENLMCLQVMKTKWIHPSGHGA
ncbi:hypothetical protein E2C01_033079 [Portunus trituberculatus]|uniref:Uncharacterized protein n=1 Tax=Portunus trituberculatus TaxID=210409 RepID=A0A5B7EWW4_PORTR|nr:hypothetical protein [Portunus trituberculatus]